jgi:hypothetical protein
LTGALLLVACSPAEVVSSTSTVGSSTTVVTSSTTTATSLAVTTTLSATTTTGPTTTTAPGLEGNWADEPLITTDFGALGWWDGAGWARADEFDELPVVGGEDYQVASLAGEGVIVGSSQQVLCDPLGNLGVEFSDDDAELLGEWPGPYGVAISAPWELQPHLFEAITPDATHSGYARDLLATRGLVVPNPIVTQAFRTDLEGDGVNEVIVVAQRLEGGYFPYEGDFSLAFMRKVVGGTVETAILGESVLTDDTTIPTVYSIGAVADLNGDAKMEIVITSAYYEGLGVEVWEHQGDDIGPTPVLAAGCGS